MFGKKIKMLLIDCDLAVILLTEDGEVYLRINISEEKISLKLFPFLKYFFAKFQHVRKILV